MRCPHCKRKVHSDDIYCVFCGASLRGKSPADPWNCVCGDEDAHRAHKSTHPRPRMRKPTGRRNPLNRIVIIIIIAAALSILPALLAGAVFFVEALVDEIHTLTVAPEPMAHPPIATEPMELEAPAELGILIAQWQGFVATADYISMDPETGELELCYTAMNETEIPIYCAEAEVMAEGCRVNSLLYLELQPGETVTDYLWIDTDALQAVGITRVEELTLSLHLEQADEYADLGWTDPLSVATDFDLPALEIRRIDHVIYRKDGLTVSLMGLATDPDYGELTLYTMVENSSEGDAVVFLENARCGDEDLHLYGFYGVPAGDRLVSKEMLYDLPYLPGGRVEVTFDYEVDLNFGTHQQTGSGSMTLELTEDGTVENISSTTGHERIY